MTWFSGWNKRKKITLTGGASDTQTDFQLKLIISYDSDMQSDFDDIRFTQSDGTTLIDAWIESKIDDTSAIVWVEFPTTPANGVDQDYYMYYGNAGVASDWDGAATFIQYHGATSASFIDSLVVPYANIAYEARCRPTSSAHSLIWGLSNLLSFADDTIYIQSHPSTSKMYSVTKNEGTQSYSEEAPSLTSGNYVQLLITCDGSNMHGYVDSNEIGSGVSTNLPNENLGLFMNIYSGSGEQDWSFARKHVANPPTYAFGSEESSTPTRMVYQGGFNTYKFNSVQIILEDVIANAMWYYNMLKRRN